MREMVIDGRVYAAYEPDEIICATPASAPNVRKMRRVEQLSRLFGNHERVGPLGSACRRSAENVHRGGHSPQTERARLRDVGFALSQSPATLRVSGWADTTR